MAIGTFSTMVPIGYIGQTGTAWTFYNYLSVDEGVASYDGTYIMAGANSTSTLQYKIATGVPADFASLLTLSYNIRYQITPLSNDNEQLKIGIYTNTGGYALADVMTIANVNAAVSWTIKGSTAFTNVNTSYGSSYFSTGIDIVISTQHTAVGGKDNSQWYIDAVEVTGTYTKVNTAPTIVLTTPSDNSQLTDSTPDLKMTGTDAESDTLEYEVKIDTQSDFQSQTTANQYIDYWTTYTSYYQLWTGSSLRGRGQTFTAAIDAILTKADWLCRKTSATPSATGYMFARIYSFPGAALLATSLPVDTQYMSTSFAYNTFNFVGENQIAMTAGTGYMVGFTWMYWAVADQIAWYVDNTESKPGSATMLYNGSSWSSTSYDLIYHVYGTTKTPLYYKKSVNGDATFTAGHPFASGTEITYTPPTLSIADYFWKARAYDPGGSNTFSSWTSYRRFYYGTPVTSSKGAYLEGFHASHDSAVHAYMNCTASGTPTAPTVEIVTPNNTSTSDTTPSLQFRGIDINGDLVEFEVQIDTSSGFDSINTISLKDIYAADSKTGTPSDGVYFEVHSGSPSGTLIGTTGTTDNASITTYPTWTWNSHAFSTALSLSRGTQYYAVKRRSGTRSTSNYYKWPCNVPVTDNANGCGYVRNSGSWTTYSTQDRVVGFYTSYWPTGGFDGYTCPMESTDYVAATWDMYGDSSSGTYEMQAQSFTTPAAIPITDVFSSPDAGFSPDTDYYNPTDVVTYTVQSALSVGTWYWRVRAIDKGGGNTYGAWSSAQTINILAAASTSVHVYMDCSQPKSHIDAYLSGKVTTLSDVPTYLFGAAGSTSDINAYLAGNISLISSQHAYISAHPQPAFEADAFQNDTFQVNGVANSFIHAFVEGDSTLPSAKGHIDAYVIGVANILADTPAYLKGSSSFLDAINAFLVGNAMSLSNADVYLKGKNTGGASAHGYLKGHSQDISDISVYLEGAGSEVTSSKPAYLNGGTATLDSVSVYIEGGSAPVTSSQSGYLTGQVGTHAHAYMLGYVDSAIEMDGTNEYEGDNWYSTEWMIWISD